MSTASSTRLVIYYNTIDIVIDMLFDMLYLNVVARQLISTASAVQAPSGNELTDDGHYKPFNYNLKTGFTRRCGTLIGRQSHTLSLTNRSMDGYNCFRRTHARVRTDRQASLCNTGMKHLVSRLEASALQTPEYRGYIRLNSFCIVRTCSRSRV